MRVLVACESSATVRDAFRARGHDAWSCDILPCDGDPQWHYQQDVTDLLDMGWDLMIAHPPCTYVCSSGLHWNKRVEGRAAKTEEALEFVRMFLDADIPKIALENPIGCISTRIRKYDQKIQPWQFGDDASKGTCLWLKGLPLLKPTNIITPAGWTLFEDKDSVPHGWDVKKVDGFFFARDKSGDYPGQPKIKPVWANQTPSGQNNLGPSKDRWKLRSKTYDGIAEAFAIQWG